MFKPSKNPKVEELTKSIRERHICLDYISPILTGEINIDGKPQRLCAWCCTEELFDGRQKYCSYKCTNSATAWAYPQKEDGIRFLLLRQDFRCAGCQYDYKPFYELVVAKDKELLGRDFDPETLPFYYFKRLKNIIPDEFRIEVDHVIPIYKGGDSLGLENHQLICFTCHKEKTKKDLSGKRKA